MNILLKKIFIFIISTFVCIYIINGIELYAEESSLEILSQTMNGWFNSKGLSNPSEGWKLKIKKLRKYTDSNYCEQPSLKCPEYVLEISLKHPEGNVKNVTYAWNMLNKKANKIDGATLNERIIFKLSHILGVRADIILVLFHANCLTFGIKYRDNKIINTTFKSCRMISSNTIVTKELSINSKDSFQKIPQKNLSIRKIEGAYISKFIKDYYDRQNATVKIISEDDQYISARISNIKSQVISNERFWETIQVSFSVIPKGESSIIRIFIDGQYAAGLSQPSILSYIDMEPLYSKALQEYSCSMLTSVKNYLVKGEK